jgi:APA family basic amino acid/polyamine antiporter
VPVLGTALDDDIMQTAGRLAADEDDDLGEGGAVIEALWIFEVPMALPLDARVPDAELKRARKSLARAKAVGEEYEGVEVATAVVRARRAGEAIVHEARRRGVEAIVLAAEEPSGVRGGLRLGGKQGLHDTFVGETTRYVVNKAPCRVILTAPPGERRGIDPMGPVPESRPLPTGHPIPAPVDGDGRSLGFPGGTASRPAPHPHAPYAGTDPDGIADSQGTDGISDPAAGARPPR